MSLAVAAVARRLALVLAPVAVPAVVTAQHVVGADVNAAAESDRVRQPLFVASAAMAPAGHLGISLQAVGTRQRMESSSTSGGAARVDSDVLTTTGSVGWGVTSWLTFGGYYAKANANETVLFAATDVPVTPPPDGAPTRQGVLTGVNSDEVGLHARVGLWRSSAGDTRVTLTGRARDRTDAAVTGAAGLAFQQRFGRLTLHLAPAAWFGDNASAAYEIDAATAFAIATRASLTAELLHVSGAAASSSPARRVTELAGGMRYRLGRLAIDAGARWVASYEQPVRDANRVGALLATHWHF